MCESVKRVRLIFCKSVGGANGEALIFLCGVGIVVVVPGRTSLLFFLFLLLFLSLLRLLAGHDCPNRATLKSCSLTGGYAMSAVRSPVDQRFVVDRRRHRRTRAIASRGVAVTGE